MKFQAGEGTKSAKFWAPTLLVAPFAVGGAFLAAFAAAAADALCCYFWAADRRETHPGGF